jgi:hypothetical protein
MESEYLPVKALTQVIKTPSGVIIAAITVYYNEDTLKILEVSYKGLP